MRIAIVQRNTDGSRSSREHELGRPVQERSRARVVVSDNITEIVLACGR